MHHRGRFVLSQTAKLSAVWRLAALPVECSMLHSLGANSSRVRPLLLAHAQDIDPCHPVGAIVRSLLTRVANHTVALVVNPKRLRLRYCAEDSAF
jgi:hypothetical protein